MNRLEAETSPYLRQHRDNPVDWYAWGSDAFAAAAQRNVPILLSVGYSACHWCHVMAHECFADDEVATRMNELFVNVKVDREERPDVDALYMDAVQAMTGRGGWPMTVFTTPDGRPFYGGTYFPKPTFLQLLTAVDEAWRNRPGDIAENVAALGGSLGRLAAVAPSPDLPDAASLDESAEQLLAAADREWGGFGGAPKFPSTSNLDFLLARGRGLDVVSTSLDAMASGGIYDHIGGGFARYSTDVRWLVPHFEKMLYDQALLVRVYTHAALVLGHDRYRQVVDETVGYVLAELRHPGGGFFSSEDADSPDADGHGREGVFTVWTPEQFTEVLGDEAGAAVAWYELDGPPNFEGRWIPSRLHHRGELARPPEIEDARRRLFAARATRSRPGLDDKVLTEWNALMLGALCEAAAAFGREDWRAAAVANGEFLLRELRRADGRWHRSWQADGDPPARHAALAADHAALVDAFTRLAELTGQARWIEAARHTADILIEHFWDATNGGFFTTADDAEALIVRQKDLLDDATPAANPSAAHALLRLGALTGVGRYADHADATLRLLGRLGLGGVALDLRLAGTTEVVVAGDRPDLLAVAREAWRPHAVLAWGERYDSPLWTDRPAGAAYVCRQYTCGLPAGDADALRRQLRGE